MKQEKKNKEKVETGAAKPTTKELFSSRASKAGGFSLVVTAIVMVIVIVVNMAVASLPTKYTGFDLTAQKEYSIGEQTLSMLASLEKDVTIYYICQKGQEDTHIQYVLQDYADNCDRIKLVNVDPYVDPGKISKYTSGDMENNSAVVVCGENYKVVYNMDLVEYDYTNYYYYGSDPEVVGYSTENAVSNAIDLVVTNKAPVIRLLTGHGEAELDEGIITYLEYSNFKHESLDLLKTKEIPADTGCVAVINPTKDFSDSDFAVLSDYLAKGGKLFLVTDTVNGKDFPNISSLLAENGILPAEGTVVETDETHTGSGFIIATQGTSEIMNNYANMNLLVSNPQGFTLSEDSSAQPLLSTTEKAYVTTTPENEEKPEDANLSTYHFACTAEVGEGGTLVYFSTASFMEGMALNYSNGANLDLFVNCFIELCGKENTFSIASSSQSYDSLTINDAAAVVLRIVFILLIPGLFLIAGIIVVVWRKKH